MKRLLSVLILCGALITIPNVWAHHRWPVNMEILVTVQGIVRDFDWSNPHSMMTIDVTQVDGNVEEWRIGGPAINRMEARGWDANTVKPGDTITGTGFQFLDGSKIIRLERVTLQGGNELLVYARE